MDLLINKKPLTEGYGDLVFENSTTPSTESFADSVAQRVYVMLRTFESEWYLNETTGIPYIQSILGKKVDAVVVDRILQQKILMEPGVASILDFSSETSAARTYEARFRVQVTTGETFTEQLDIGEF